MSLEINRRSFLQALIAAGASFALPSKATNAQVDKVWAEAQANPWIFEVNDHGTLVDADIAEPEIWSDFFDIATNNFKDPKGIILEVQGCQPLISYLDRQLDREIESLEDDLDFDPPDDPKILKALQKKIADLKQIQDEYGEPWQDWVELEGMDGIAKFQKLIDDWLGDSVDWMQSEWFPARSGPQGIALGFFQDQKYELLDALGVVIVEGEHPGSSYFAAELRQDVDWANQSAEALGLPFRFKREAA